MGWDQEMGGCDNFADCDSWVRSQPFPAETWSCADGTPTTVVCFDPIWDEVGGYSEDQKEQIKKDLAIAGWAEAQELPYERGTGYRWRRKAELGGNWLFVKYQPDGEARRAGWANAIELPYEWKKSWTLFDENPHQVLTVTHNRPEGFFVAVELPYYYQPEDDPGGEGYAVLRVLDSPVARVTSILAEGWIPAVDLDCHFRSR